MTIASRPRRLVAERRSSRRRALGRTLAVVGVLVASALGAGGPASAQVAIGPAFAGAPSAVATASGGPAFAATGGPGFGTYRWPVHGPVIRPYEEPANPYSAGHRGIDIGAPFGTTIRAPADGTVSFAGTVAGSLFISVDHAGGIRTSYSWVSAVSVRTGQVVTTGTALGKTGQGHPGSDATHLHFSARLNGTYIDPMLLLGGGNLDDVIHLAPNDG
jgi:murein DD-endopeptidase MepM/ murein hydrolase activator NlpD